MNIDKTLIFMANVTDFDVTLGVMRLLVSLPAWRFKGDYFVMISIAVQTLIYATLYNWKELTNGPFGISGIAHPIIAGYRFVTTGSIIVLYGLLALGLGLIMAKLKWSRFGRSLQAMRDDELAARSIGMAQASSICNRGCNGRRRRWAIRFVCKLHRPHLVLAQRVHTHANPTFAIRGVYEPLSQ